MRVMWQTKRHHRLGRPRCLPRRATSMAARLSPRARPRGSARLSMQNGGQVLDLLIFPGICKAQVVARGKCWRQNVWARQKGQATDALTQRACRSASSRSSIRCASRCSPAISMSTSSDRLQRTSHPHRERNQCKSACSRGSCLDPKAGNASKTRMCCSGSVAISLSRNFRAVYLGNAVSSAASALCLAAAAHLPSRAGRRSTGRQGAARRMKGRPVASKTEEGFQGELHSRLPLYPGLSCARRRSKGAGKDRTT